MSVYVFVYMYVFIYVFMFICVLIYIAMNTSMCAISYPQMRYVQKR